METRDLTPDLLTDLGENVRRLIKYEGELDQGFGDEIARLVHGENFYTCIQCGTCSATCPVSHFMDFTPRRIKRKGEGAPQGMPNMMRKFFPDNLTHGKVSREKIGELRMKQIKQENGPA